MTNLKLILAACILSLGLSTAAFAGSPKTDAKDSKATPVANTANTDASAVGKTTTKGTAAFQYIGGDVNDPSSYGTTQVDGDDLCDNSGSTRCAATFTTDGLGHRTGSPTTPIWTKK